MKQTKLFISPDIKTVILSLALLALGLPSTVRAQSKDASPPPLAIVKSGEWLRVRFAKDNNPFGIIGGQIPAKVIKLGPGSWVKLSSTVNPNVADGIANMERLQKTPRLLARFLKDTRKTEKEFREMKKKSDATRDELIEMWVNFDYVVAVQEYKIRGYE